MEHLEVKLDTKQAILKLEEAEKKRAEFERTKEERIAQLKRQREEAEARRVDAEQQIRIEDEGIIKEVKEAELKVEEAKKKQVEFDRIKEKRIAQEKREREEAEARWVDAEHQIRIEEEGIIKHVKEAEVKVEEAKKKEAKVEKRIEQERREKEAEQARRLIEKLRQEFVHAQEALQAEKDKAAEDKRLAAEAAAEE